MSAPTLGMTTQLNDSFNYVTTDPLGNPVQLLVNMANSSKMAYGQIANGANATTTLATKLFVWTFSIPIASSIHDVDLTQLVDIFGNPLNFSKIYELIIRNNDLATGSGLIAKPGPANGWTGPWNGISTSQQSIPAGGKWVQESPYTGFNVNSGSKILRLQNDAASPTGAALSVTMVLAGN